MNWLEKLHETYENCATQIGKSVAVGKKGKQIWLLPIFHTTQNAQIEITIDSEGRFRRAVVIPKNEAPTIIPCTEESGGRTSGPVSHPLCDKLEYVAGDYHLFVDAAKDFLHQMYLQGLSNWCLSSSNHPKVKAVYEYVKRGTIIADLCAAKVLLQDSITKKLLDKWTNPSVEAPLIFKVMPNKISPSEAFVRWSVEIEGVSQSALSFDTTAWDSWAQYYYSTQTSFGFCYMMGKSVILAKNHPSKLRNAGDKAKLISANDRSGFTYRGRFSDPDGNQVSGLGLETSQKAHNALRWLIARQGYQDGSLAIVAWSTTGQSVPDPLADSRMLFEEESDKLETSSPSSSVTAYTAEDFAFRLKQKIKGYTADLGQSHQVVVLGLDSATPGRLSVIYYREIAASALLDRIEMWHTDCAWHQNYGANTYFIGAPAPKDIAEIVYGRRVDDALRRNVVNQLLPCILDGSPLPQYLVDNCIRRVSNRLGMETWEWEKALGIACALFRKKYKHKRVYQMYLELDYVSRDYLYGRLLAIADQIEYSAFRKEEKKRMTTAARFMQRFADQPYSTWRTICLALQPYKARLLANSPGWLFVLEKEMDAVTAAFTPENFASPLKLSGEFLLGYHCQRAALQRKPRPDYEKSADESKD
jgi:CRISPR-associated protein Csd1